MQQTLAVFTLLMWLVFPLTVLILLARQFLAERRIRTLQRLGRIVDGEVVSCRVLRKSGRTSEVILLQYRLENEFMDVVKGKQKSRRERQQNETLPIAGKPVAVLYLNERIHRAL